MSDQRVIHQGVLLDKYGFQYFVDSMAIPRVSVTPLVGVNPTRMVLKTTNAASSASKILGWRVAVAPGGDSIAAIRLAEHGEDTTFIPVNSDYTLKVDTEEEFSVYVACVANVAYNNAAGTILPTGTSEANTTTAMTKLDLEAGTNILQFVISDNYDLPPSGSPLLYSMLTMEGRKNA